MEEESKSINFHEMELDERILMAIAKMGWLKPTLIQEKAIPLVLENKDVLIRARTGSGKTAAFAVPVIQKIIHNKQTAIEQSTSVLILAPSKELCQQIKNVVENLITLCGRIVRCVDLASKTETSAQKHILSEKPDIIISTPAKILNNLRQENIVLKESLKTLVVDEADLMFSFGFAADLKEVLEYFPDIYQSVLASATLSADVLELKQVMLHSPVVLKLQEPDIPPTSQLSHYHIQAEEDDKAAILYTLYKLHLIKGKSIIFVNTVDKCYRLKLFLEQYRIRSCVLNSELPANVRCHTVNQFNQGMYDIIIASDERALENPHEQLSKLSGKTKTSKSDKSASVARGIDFFHVSNVINFDFPLDISAYIHRAGRTARGNNTGNVLSFVCLKEKPLMDQVDDHLKIGQGADETILKKYEFKLEQVEPFRYRAKDGWRAITRKSIRESRLKEIKLEMLNSDKLKGYFDNNPRDLQVLRHDKLVNTVKIQQHLADVPDYIVPSQLKHLTGIVTRKRKQNHSKSNKFNDKKNNPLLIASIDYAKKKKF